MTATLIVLGGLPGTGKSTIAAELQRRATIAYVRIDSIEHALQLSGELNSTRPETAGYMVGYAVARDLLRGGCRVLVECVNPIELTRQAWRDVAADSGADVVEVELCCSDVDVHRHRVENRSIDIPHFELPNWSDVQSREYEPWPNASIRIDTASQSPASAADAILTVMTTVDDELEN